MGTGLVGPKELTFGQRVFASPDGVKHTGPCRISDFSETFNLEKQTAQIELLYLAGREGNAKKVIHEDTFMCTKINIF
jgi:hypothetical protein